MSFQCCLFFAGIALILVLLNNHQKRLTFALGGLPQHHNPTAIQPLPYGFLKLPDGQMVWAQRYLLPLITGQLCCVSAYTGMPWSLKSDSLSCLRPAW